jgi:HK97 family phage major capsid protein
MAILNSKQLWQERQRLADEQAKLVSDGKADDARIVEGQIKQLDITLDHVIEEEDKLRTAPKQPQKVRMSFGERILGPRDEFRGIELGFKKSAPVKDAVVTVGAPTEVELELDGKSASLLANFANTLPETPSIGSVSYKQRGKQTGNPATWAGVSDGVSATKQEIVYAWKDATALKETIAGYVPVSKDTLMDYDELLSIINGDLLIDLAEVTDAKYLTGNNPNGIIGIANTTGIQELTTAMAGKYFDAIRHMRTMVMENARRIPTHVCISPEIKEAIDLYKTSTGLYQTLGDNVYWGMQVVEDSNCDGIIVYDAFAATRRSIHDTTVEIGYHDDQFIKNELSILAEQTKALQVRYPDAFCHATKANLDKASA